MSAGDAQPSHTRRWQLTAEAPALRVARHLVPVHALVEVVEEAVVDVRPRRRPHLDAGQRDGREAESMAELVEHHRQELDQRALVAVDAVVPAEEAARIAQVGIERDVDVGEPPGLRSTPAIRLASDCWYQVLGNGALAKLRCEDPAPALPSTAPPASQVCGVEGGVDQDLHRARQDAAPDAGRVVEHEEPLGADRGAGIAADRRGRRGIVEAFSRAVEIDDRDGGRLGDACESQKQRAGDEYVSSRSHGYFPPFVAEPAADGANARFKAASPCTHWNVGFPSGPMRMME